MFFLNVTRNIVLESFFVKIRNFKVQISSLTSKHTQLTINFTGSSLLKVVNVKNYIYAKKPTFIINKQSKLSLYFLQIKRIGLSSVVSRRLLCNMIKIGYGIQQTLFVKRKRKF